jgi:hypothetical protein
VRVFALVRYRFFLYAGLLPYLLGAAWAYAIAGHFDAALFWSGLGGVVLSVIGVEAFNEYFDARMAAIASSIRKTCRPLPRRSSGLEPSPSRRRSQSGFTWHGAWAGRS